MFFSASSEYWITRFCFQRFLGLIYWIGFLIIINQFIPLCGSKGLLPAQTLFKRLTFWDIPSLFWINSSDSWLKIFAWIGLLLAGIALTGISDAFHPLFSVFIWTSLWVIYLSYVNIGRTFYGFGWETLLLETGFIAIFLGSTQTEPSAIPIGLLRWILFRLMFGAGLIKLRGDPCWRDLTCMQFHYETQPMPNPLSWYFHHLPPAVHRMSVLFTHFVEILVPFGYFGPSPVRTTAGILTIVFQFILILSGNLSWLNYITIVISIACFEDGFFNSLSISIPRLTHAVYSIPAWIHYLLLGAVAVLSYRPTLNLISKNQIMNTSFDSLHLVNTYGAFGSIGRTRYEIIIEGTDDPVITSATTWKEYEFKGKPGKLDRRPPIISPYHLRLDWQMWFAAMSSYWDHPWFLKLVARLLEGDRSLLKLLRENPFPNRPPVYIRALLYEYHFTSRTDPSSKWWNRTLVEEYLPPVSRDNESFQSILERIP